MRRYVTLLSSDNYLEGVLTLHYSMKLVGSEYPLCCLVSTTVSESVETTIKNHGIETIRLVEPAITFKANNVEWASNWDFTFDKLKVWGLTQFEKIVFVDSDMLVIKNIDHLFERPATSAALAGVLFPSCEQINFLNSGLMVIEPSKDIESKLISLAKVLAPQMRREGKAVGDQDIINAYYSDWFEHKGMILDDGYNLYAQYLQCYIRHHGYSLGRKGKPIYIIHYVGATKPWMIHGLKDVFAMMKRWFPNLYYYRAVLLYNSMKRIALK